MQVAFGFGRSDVVRQRYQVDLARRVVIGKDRQRANKGAFGQRRLVCLAIAEQQEVEARRVELRIEPLPVRRVVGGGGLSTTLGFGEQRPQYALELGVC